MTRAGQLANADSSTRARAGHVSYTRSGQAGRRQAWQSEAKPGKLEAEGKLTGDSPPQKKAGGTKYFQRKSVYSIGVGGL